MKKKKLFLATAFWLATTVSPLTSVLWATALDDYVYKEDNSYSWKEESCQEHEQYWYCVLSMTSQTWRSLDEVTTPVWKHWLTLIIPKGTTARSATLNITGGINTKPAPTDPNPQHVTWAMATQSVFAEVSMVPNAPLHFTNDPDPALRSTGRGEDAIIAYSWLKYFQTGDPTWPLRMPMTRAAVKAMDTVQAFCSTFTSQPIEIDSFAVTGRSKRGWTAWTVAAVDKRVIAVIPIVIDVLNVRACIIHQYNSLGYWYPSLQAYVSMGINEFIMTPSFDAMMALEDPYCYRQRLTMPKYIINAAGDRFFLPDSSQFYFHELSGVKYLRYIPNADHELEGINYLAPARVFYQAIASNKKLPTLSWEKGKNGELTVKTDHRPLAVRLWQATNPAARDFRVAAIGKAYTSSDLVEVGPGTYCAAVAPPKSGWTAFFVELSFDSGEETPYIFTTDVFITPDTYPFDLMIKPPSPST